MWEWIPNKSLGNIALGEQIKRTKSKYDLLEDEKNASTGWTTFYIPIEDVYVDVEEDEVISITSYKTFCYLDTNCIGLNILELGELLDTVPDEIGQPVIFDDGEVKIPREYYQLGLQVWTSDNIVSSISCLTYEN